MLSVTVTYKGLSSKLDQEIKKAVGVKPYDTGHGHFGPGLRNMGFYISATEKHDVTRALKDLADKNKEFKINIRVFDNVDFMDERESKGKGTLIKELFNMLFEEGSNKVEQLKAKRRALLNKVHRSREETEELKEINVALRVAIRSTLKKGKRERLERKKEKGKK